MLEIFEPEALHYFTFFRSIRSTLSVCRNPILTHLPVSGFLDIPLCVLIAPTPGLAFPPDATHASGGVIIFVRRGLSFSELSTSFFSSLDPYSDYVGVNISLNNSSSLSLMCMPPIRSSPTDGRTDSFSSSSRNLFILGDFNCHHSLWDSRGTSDPCREKVFDWVTSPSMTLTHPPFSVALFLTCPLLPPLLPFHAPGRCFRTWVLITYQSFYLSLSLGSFAPTSVFLPSTFRKLAGMALTPTVLLQRNTRLFPLLLLFFISLALNAAKSSIPFDCIKRPPKAWRSAEVEGAVSERRKTFAATHRSNKDRQAYISASRHASSVIAKAEAW